MNVTKASAQLRRLKEGKSPSPPQMSGQWGIFPPELYLLLLECLNYNDETAKCSLAILNLSLLSRSHHELVSRWVSWIGEADCRPILQHEADGNIPPTKDKLPRTHLALHCKRLAAICAVYNCRKETNELFTGIPLCQACDAFYFPKITAMRFNELFKATLLGQQNATNLKFESRKIYSAKPSATGLRCNGSGPIFRWGDLKILFSDGHFVRRLIRPGNTSRVSQVYNAEDYGILCPPSSKVDSERFWPMLIIWARACARWDALLGISLRDNLRPVVLDMILLRHFRYLFDRNWEPERGLQDEVRNYLKIACRWAASSDGWLSRPWRISNFPLLPRSLNTESILSKTRPTAGFYKYQDHCERIRRLFKRFPQILLFPVLCRKGFSANDELNLDDLQGDYDGQRLCSYESFPENMDFILHGDRDNVDVGLVRACESPADGMRTSVANSRMLDVVRIRNDSFEIINM